jgi:glycerophosphoryl diester phosphodiesterase
MSVMSLISHRGARGLGPENTLESIRKAALLNVDYIEFDVQRTTDNQPVLFHDQHTKSGALVQDITLLELQKQHPDAPTLGVALIACGNATPLVELKSEGSARVSKQLILDHESACVTSFMGSELLEMNKDSFNRKRFLMQHKHPFGIIKKAKRTGATGIGINKNWLIMLPHYYWHGRRNNLEIYTYTLNSALLAKLLVYFMPALSICTDNPHKNLSLLSGQNKR